MDSNKFFTSHPIEESVTITGKAAVDIPDVRGKAVVFDGNGNIAVASDPAKPILGIALITSGVTNAPNGNGAVKAGEDIDIQVGAMGYASAGAAVKPGDPLTTNSTGDLVSAVDGNFVIATALNTASTGGTVYFQITKYMAGQTAQTPAT